MGKVNNLRSPEYLSFSLILAINLGFLVLAFVIDRPGAVLSGFLKIIQTRSLLITDYIAIGGIGATLLNVSMVGIFSVLMLTYLDIKPNGQNTMALWMTIGFAFFGKDILNMLPLICGVFLFARFRKQKFSDYYLAALLVTTLSPTINEVAFLGMFNPWIEISGGILLGLLIGFIFPAISTASLKIHRGFNLYNMGLAGGLVATVLATSFKSFGIHFTPVDNCSEGNNVFFAAMLYAISALLLAVGFFAGPSAESPKERIKRNWRSFLKLHKQSGRLSTDFYQMYGNSAFINMAVLCIFSTTMVLALGAELNGPSIAGIFTMTAFGGFGKHMRNVIPVIIGAVLAEYVSRWDPTAPTNMVAILFSAGLAPIAGMFGWHWGIIAGFLHVNIAMYIGTLNSGLNLYNSGFAATFVVMFLLPIITIFKKEHSADKEKATLK